MVEILVANPEYFDAEAMSILRRAGKVTAKKMTKAQLERSISRFDAIVVRVDTKLDRAVLQNAKRLRIIGSATTGLDHIDAEYAERRGVKIISLHGAHTVSTAQHAIAMMFALSRKIPWAFDSMRQGKWNRSAFIGVELEGKTLGVVGLGRIGSRVASYGIGLGMKVLGNSPNSRLKGVKTVSLELLLKESDIISLHAALNDTSRNLITSKQLRMMKKTAMLVNTSRGEIVNTSDLLKALNSGTIAGAALDVYPDEPLLGSNNRFAAQARKTNNLILTPHIGASTRDAVHRAGVEIATKVCEELTSR